MSSLTLTLTADELKQVDERVNRSKGESRESFAVEALRERVAKTKPMTPAAQAKAAKAAGSAESKE